MLSPRNNCNHSDVMRGSLSGDWRSSEIVDFSVISSYLHGHDEWAIRAAAGPLKRLKTATAPVLMPGAHARAPSIDGMSAPRAVCEAIAPLAADATCLDCGSAAKTLVRACCGRLSVATGTARARWLRWRAVSCWAEMLPIIHA